MTIAVDLVAAQLVMTYWFPDAPGWVWSALFLGIMFLLNWISVKGFGEAEYWFSLIKVATVIIFIIVGVMMIFGIFKGAQPAGWSNWVVDDAPFAGGFAAMIGVAMIVGFSFQEPSLSASRPASRKTRRRTFRAPCGRCSGVSCCSMCSPS